MASARRPDRSPTFGKIVWKKHCRWCRGPLPPRRSSFCSDGCVREYLIAYDAGYMRQLLYDRDKGVCQSCGLHTSTMEAQRESVHQLPHRSRIQAQRKEDALSLLEDEFESRGIPGWVARKQRSLWDADHIIPVADGGLLLGLNNIRTLCIGCHQKVTKMFAAERARRRK